MKKKNYTILKDGQVCAEADTINWISFLKDESIGKKIETAPMPGHLLMADLEVPSIANLDLNSFDKDALKAKWSFKTGKIIEVVHISRELIKFTTDEGAYEVVVNNLNMTPKPKTSPVSHE